MLYCGMLIYYSRWCDISRPNSSSRSPTRCASGFWTHFVNGELTVGELQQYLAAEQSTVSQHLAALRSKELVSGRREDTSVKYTVSDAAIWQMLDIARDIYERQLRSHQVMLEASR